MNRIGPPDPVENRFQIVIPVCAPAQYMQAQIYLARSVAGSNHVTSREYEVPHENGMHWFLPICSGCP